MQEDSRRVQRQLVSVQEESTAQLRVSQDEAVSILEVSVDRCTCAV